MTSKFETAIVALVTIAIVLSATNLYYSWSVLDTVKPKGPEEVKVGFVFGLTGAAAKEGEAARRTYEMAVKEVNDAGGIKSLNGLKIKSIWADNQWNPAVAAAETERLITQEGVVSVFGCIWSSVTLPAAQVCERYQVPMVGGDASSPRLTNGQFKYYFRIVANDDMFGLALFQFMKDAETRTGTPINKIAYLYEDSSFGSGCRAGWLTANNDTTLGGYTVAEDIAYSSSTADVTSEVLRLKTADPDVILMAGYVSDGLLFARTFKQLDYMPKAILTQDGVNKPEFIAGVAGTNLADYYLNVLSWNRDVSKPKSIEVRDKYESLYGEQAYTDVIGWYSAFRTWYLAVEKAASLEPKKIRDALSSIEVQSDLIPSVGSVKFDANGQNIRIGLVMAQFKNGTWTTVYPWDVAAKPVVFPVPKWSERT
jgi:branched-chain amino acid transport system substrate-binding protein